MAIRYARHLAITSADNVILCGSSDGRQCDGDWQRGQIIVQAKQVVRYFTGFPGAYKISWRGSLGQHKQLVFVPMYDSAMQQGSFYIKGPKQCCRIVLNRIGRSRVICD